MVAAISRISNRTDTPPRPEGGDEESDISVLIARLTAEVDQIACEKTRSIQQITERSRGERMVDLALNAIELIDRNLYERTCDVRWWATDSAVVDCAAD